MISSLAAKWIIVVKSVETAKKLNKDCGLDEAEELDKNLKRFLEHIGKSFLNIYQDSYLPKLYNKERDSRWWSETRKIDMCTQNGWGNFV